MNAAGVASTLQSKGQAITLTRTTTGDFDPVTGSDAAPIVQEFTVYGITANYGTQTKQAASNNPGSLIQSGDKQAIISAGTVEPLPGDELTISGQNWKVIAVDTIDPAGTALLYKCQVRK